jgi:tol-pal system protein YbgF
MGLYKHNVVGWRAAWRHAVLTLCLLSMTAPIWAASKDEIALAARLSKLERTLNGSGLIELSKQIEALQQEVRQLRGELENQAFTLEQARKAQRDAYADNDRRLSVLEQGGSVGSAGVPSDPPLSTLDSPTDVAVAGKPSDQTMAVEMASPQRVQRRVIPIEDAIDASDEAAAELQPPPMQRPTMVLSPNDPPPGRMRITPSEPTRIARQAVDDDGMLVAPAASVAVDARSETAESEATYRDAFALLKAGQYDQSIKGFTSYLQQYPNGQYADNAQFWVGEAYYVTRRFEPAIAQYQNLIANYPESQKQAQARLKIGYSFDELGRRDEAVQILIQLKRDYPDSAAAQLAEQRLERVRAKAP